MVRGTDGRARRRGTVRAALAAVAAVALMGPACASDEQTENAPPGQTTDRNPASAPPEPVRSATPGTDAPLGG